MPATRQDSFDGEDESEDEEFREASEKPGGGAKAKGGRKKDPESQSARKVQNRIAQREFRQRKQQYIRELETRVEVLSANSDERSDHLRDVLRALMAENTQLRDLVKDLGKLVGEGLGTCLPRLGMTAEIFEEIMNKGPVRSYLAPLSLFVALLSDFGLRFYLSCSSGRDCFGRVRQVEGEDPRFRWSLARSRDSYQRKPIPEGRCSWVQEEENGGSSEVDEEAHARPFVSHSGRNDDDFCEGKGKGDERRCVRIRIRFTSRTQRKEQQQPSSLPGFLLNRQQSSSFFHRSLPYRLQHASSYSSTSIRNLQQQPERLLQLPEPLRY
ncbi:hypothetical protein BDY24DRAFT_243796 [Mrakia frigida]|uniref:bZIP transcription factor n=1 Tax=Mrakia frigida TaxID=29902 RepID=UPI003FCBF652